ncbi:MAG: AI-2E family transporter [Nonlabens sp.]
MSHKIPAPAVRQAMLLALLVFLVYLIAGEMMPYIGGVLGAVTLYVLLAGLQNRLEGMGWKPTYAALLLVTGSIITILLPIVGIGILFTSKITTAIKNSEKITDSIKEQLARLEHSLGFKLADQVNSDDVGNWVSSSLRGLVSSGMTIFIAIGILVFVLYYLLVERKTWKKALLTYMPLKTSNVKTIGQESASLVKSNAIGIPMVALLQGVVALVGYFIFGVEQPFFWFVITAVGSMIPFVGTALGILPVFLLLMSQGETGNAIGILIYGVVVVGATDNLFRLVVQRKLADIHPLVTLIGVVVGVPLFGFIGLVFGPLLVSLFLLVLKIYKNEYGAGGERL